MSAETAPLRAVPGRLWYYLIARLLDTAATAGLVTIVGKQIFDMATRQGASEERVLFLLGVLLHPDNRERAFPLVLTGPAGSERYLESLDGFIRDTLGDQAADLYRVIPNDAAAVAREGKVAK